MQEEELIKKLQHKNGKEEAFRFLVKRYKRPLYALVRKITIDHEDANEVTQLTFIKAFKYIDGFKGNSKIYTWLYTIARREAIQFMHEKAKQRNTSIEELSLTAMEQLKAHSTYYSGDEIQLKLQKAVAMLPQKQREVFNMKYFDNLKYSEISEITGTSEGGLKANYHLAVNNLKANLQLD
ncbi:RNA polymerase sigma factor [Galbibacter sp. BG1]|uniref:RNA polymerase sigma factor n=1 Tax=Galbibacter sp. BG1 TaxID=1170699 RepID=UPI0015B9F0FB|nr:RNA polymerase sigma factor [Galbibacter sp. BG1]QLE00203.1 RNA polymerase sigma factor [Galbibacter sp. BG1]